MRKITVMLVDDHEVVRSGYRTLLECAGDIEVIAEAVSGEEAYANYPKFRPDIVVMDLSMPGTGGLETLRRLIVRDPDARILIFSMHENETYLHRALEAGAMGYVTKRSAAQTIVEALRQVARGTLYIAQEMVPYLTRRASERHPTLVNLSTREFEVFLLLAQGLSVNEIADVLKLSAKTVGHHFTHIKSKTGVPNQVALSRLAIRAGLIEA